MISSLRMPMKQLNVKSLIPPEPWSRHSMHLPSTLGSAEAGRPPSPIATLRMRLLTCSYRTVISKAFEYDNTTEKRLVPCVTPDCCGWGLYACSSLRDIPLPMLKTESRPNRLTGVPCRQLQRFSPVDARWDYTAWPHGDREVDEARRTMCDGAVNG
jgi:hypothetical protein